ncbi:hypothetical protein AKJ09_09920 [Labilithrix luteola]|uniref:Zinc-finger domain-containing protein n=2 Tax=Labilithrix luteola TaxID=1391654 RepID=A0A0K1QC78_9BACT|nr:hypothetical protein AKJ09_09920 [Labilithrix luteola]
MLPEELLWAEGGHASDVVLTALADGQLAIVPPNVRAHVEGCDLCTTHLGHAALLSIHTGAGLAAPRETASQTERAPFPRLAITLGLAVAVLGLVPTLLQAPSTARAFAGDVPLVAGAVSTLSHRFLAPGSPLMLASTYGAAVLLVMVAVVVVRRLPKKEISS